MFVWFTCRRHLRTTSLHDRLCRYTVRTLYLCLWLMTVMGEAEATAWAQDCALKVKVDTRDPVAYQPRGNRCEGTYGKPMAATINLRIVGFHLGYPDFDSRKDGAARITVRPYQAAQRILVRVVSTRPKAYFQMDTSALSDDGRFIWPLDVVRQLREPLRPLEMAAWACVANCQGNRATLLPVHLSASAADEKPQTALTVLVMAGVELSSLKATLRRGGDIVFENLPVGGRYLSPDTPIRIPMDRVEAGEVVLSLTALTRSGQQDYVEAVLRIPPRVE